MIQGDLPAGWQWKTIGEVCRVVPGFAFKSKDWTSDGIPVLKIKNIRSDCTVDVSEADCVPEAIVTEKLNKFRLGKGDILIAMTGATAGKVGWLSADGGFLLNQRVAKLEPVGINKLFFWGVVSGRRYQDLFFHLADGAAQPNMSGKQIEGVPIPVPPIALQGTIAGMVAAYDDLIETNTRRIAILEEMARRLYEEWFVHFRFPGHEEAGFNGELPAGWQPSTVKESVERFTTGKKFDQKTVNTAGSVPVLDQGKTGIIGYHDEEPGFQASWDDPVIVFANHTCYQRLVMFPFSSIQNVIPFKSSTQFPRNIYWLHHATVGLVELNDYKGHWPQFAAKEISIPPAELTDEFGSRVAPLHMQVRLLQQKNANLRAQRDLLLPKLVSGEIDVSGAEAALEAAE